MSGPRRNGAPTGGRPALTTRRALYLLRAFAGLARARLRHAVRPAGEIVHGLQQPSPPSSQRDQAFDVDCAGWAISAAARRAPFRADCLLQCMAAAQWLRGHGLQPQFHLGVASDGEGGLGAHAWLSLDGRVIVGDGPKQTTPLDPAA